MASNGPPFSKRHLPRKQELIDAIMTIVDAELGDKSDIPGSDANSSTSSSSCPSFDVTCVKGLLTNEPDHVYRFQPNNLDAKAPERLSFAELADKWNHSEKDRKRDYGSFPEVRGATAKGRFTQCTLRCMCDYCNEGEPVELHCRPYPFGETGEILVHEFNFCSKKWAVILGTWESPDEYRLWGAWKDDPNVTAYNEWIRLKEVDIVESTGSKRPERASNASAEQSMHRTKRNRMVRQVSHSFLEHNGEETPSFTKHKRSARDSRGRSAKSPLSLFMLGHDDDEEDDDEEEKLPLRELQAHRINPTPQWATTGARTATPVTGTIQPTQRGSGPSPSLHLRDLKAEYEAIKLHLTTQHNYRNLPIASSDHKIQRALKGLHHHARQGDNKNFDTIRRAIERELADLGLSALPGTQDMT